jgi:hypothetical protein
MASLINLYLKTGIVVATFKIASTMSQDYTDERICVENLPRYKHLNSDEKDEIALLRTVKTCGSKVVNGILFWPKMLPDSIEAAKKLIKDVTEK